MSGRGNGSNNLWFMCCLRGTNTVWPFQNISCCPAVSESNFTCNSNVNIIADGPIGMYTVKCVVKDNASDDTAEYSEMDASMKKMGNRTHDDDRAEALRIICRAAFAHNKQNVISAPMASFLLRNESRFYFSHKFVFCPLKDVVRLHNKQEVNGTLNVPKEGSTFFENLALHYLCRHEDLEDVCLKDFCENYEVVYCPTRQKKKTTLSFPYGSRHWSLLPPFRCQER